MIKNKTERILWVKVHEYTVQEDLDGEGGRGGGGSNVSCQLKFWLFVSCQLSFRLFVSCQLNG